MHFIMLFFFFIIFLRNPFVLGVHLRHVATLSILLQELFIDHQAHQQNQYLIQLSSQQSIILSYLLSTMQRIHRHNTDHLHEPYTNPLQYNKSPIKRQNINHANTARSPIRSRTPNRSVSPIKLGNNMPSSIKYISNVSPSKQKQGNHENQSQLSNGKSIKYINYQYTDKIYQTVRKDKYQQFNKKSDRIMNDENRLFGKIVQKIQSGKKSTQRGQQSSYKTSVFDNSDSKGNRMEQTIGRTQPNISKQLFTQVIKTEPKSDKKNSSKNKDILGEEEGEKLNCIVYKINHRQRTSNTEISRKQIGNDFQRDNTSAKMASILVKRKSSKTQTQDHNSPNAKYKKKDQIVEQSQDFSDFNAFIDRIQNNKNQKAVKVEQDLVKMSIKVQQSLNMDPFI